MDCLGTASLKEHPTVHFNTKGNTEDHLCPDTMPAFNTHERTQGRLNYQISCNNQENTTLPEVELFSEAAPRAPMPTGANLIVSNINMYENMNKVAHHTKAYNLSQLIIRRGQEFIMGIVFNRPFNPGMDMFFIEFVIGNNPSITQHTLICLNIGRNNQTNPWGVRIVEISNSETKVGITPAADGIVGLYSTYVSVITGYGKQRSQRDQTTDFYMLFNPWSSVDQVYLNNEDERQEYVLNDVGMIYNGDYTDIGTRPWNYGQFQKGILEACIFIMDLGKMPLQYRGNAEQVVRKASALMNSLADNGVLVGNWGSDFGKGTSPSAWTGSVEILRQYYTSGGVSVKYGQCWVFAGVYNTFLRCLGLPARVITNYCSAHDSGGQLTTDIILNDDGSLDTDNSDSIWNFHCWNEVFIKRTSMPNIYSGWQVVDATPQEISDGYYRCGPTAVTAIKTKSLGYAFDAPFVYAEVNSDVIFYQKDIYGNMNVIFQDSNYVGKLVLTKMIGSSNYNNITDSYKNIKSMLRRQTPEEDSCGSGSNRFILPDTDVQLFFEATKNNKDIILTMTFNNLSNEPRTITCKITGKVEYYTGATRTQFSFITHDVSLQALETKQEVITVTADRYKNFIMGQSFLSFIVYALINETTMSLTAMKSIHVQPPPLQLEVSKVSHVGKDMFAILSFTNTLGYDLTDVTVRMEGIHLFPVKTKTYRNIHQGTKIKWIESFKPLQAGAKTLVACLDCSHLRNVSGHLDIVIQHAEN